MTDAARTIFAHIYYGGQTSAAEFARVLHINIKTAQKHVSFARRFRPYAGEDWPATEGDVVSVPVLVPRVLASTETRRAMKMGDDISESSVAALTVVLYRGFAELQAAGLLTAVLSREKLRDEAPCMVDMIALQPRWKLSDAAAVPVVGLLKCNKHYAAVYRSRGSSHVTVFDSLAGGNDYLIDEKERVKCVKSAIFRTTGVEPETVKPVQGMNQAAMLAPNCMVFGIVHVIALLAVRPDTVAETEEFAIRLRRASAEESRRCLANVLEGYRAIATGAEMTQIELQSGLYGACGAGVKEAWANAARASNAIDVADAERAKRSLPPQPWLAMIASRRGSRMGAAISAYAPLVRNRKRARSATRRA